MIALKETRTEAKPSSPKANKIKVKGQKLKD